MYHSSGGRPYPDCLSEVAPAGDKSLYFQKLDKETQDLT
jgi:hypothetical protein